MIFISCRFNIVDGFFAIAGFDSLPPRWFRGAGAPKSISATKRLVAV
jgi:hypothetical protein